MIDLAVEALRRHGVGRDVVLRDSGAARGAIYHHFPRGKTQLVAEAATRNGEQVRAALETLPSSDPLTLVTAFLAAVRPIL